MYKRYAYDLNAAVTAVPEGWNLRLEDMKLIKSENDATDDSPEVRTFRILTQIANSISPMLQWEQDLPSFHPSGMVPMFDTQVFVDKNDRVNPIKHKYYRKDMCQNRLISRYSTMPTNVKNSILVKEGLRRVKNNSSGLDVSSRI